MDIKAGDRVSLDGRKVGSSRRTGVVRQVSQGLSGPRYTVQWDTGETTSFAPAAGVLQVEKGGRNGTRKASSGKAAVPVKAKPAKPGARKKGK